MTVSLAEPLPGKKGKSSFMLDSALPVGHEKSVWPPASVLIKVSVYFYNSRKKPGVEPLVALSWLQFRCGSGFFFFFFFLYLAIF